MNEDGLTIKERDILEAYARYGRIDRAAAHMGMAPQTMKNALSTVYRVLQVDGAIGAFKAMGWLRIDTASESDTSSGPQP